MLHMEDQHRKIVEDILKKYPYRFYAFGSRVKGTQKRLSDLDICFMEPIPHHIWDHIEADFEESDLPYKVDIIDWNACDVRFQEQIKGELEPIPAS